MIVCLNCENELKFDKRKGFLVKCSNCGWFSRIKIVGIENNATEILTNPLSRHEISAIKSKFPNSKIKRDNEKLILCYKFNTHALALFKEISKKTGEVLEKFLHLDKEGLSNDEKNILYKLKSSSIKEIYKKIDYLKAKLDCIELLHHLDF